MILSATYSDYKLAERSPVIYRGEMAACFEQIAQDGFQGVEIHSKDTGSYDAEEVSEVLDRYGLRLTSLGTGLLRQMDGLSLTSDDEACRIRAVQRLKEFIDFAAHFEDVVVIIGLLRGKMSEADSAEHYWARLSKHLIECADYATEKHVRLGLEMINRYEADTLNSAQDGLRYLKELEHPAIGLHLDSYHMNIEEADIRHSLELSAKQLVHVHLADSDRYYPGHGHMDFKEIFETLGEISYTGAVAVEALSKPDARTAGSESVRFLEKYVH